jgi:WD40 repeat protein
MILKGHEPFINKFDFKLQPRQVSFISYFPDGKRMFSASFDMTIRQWDLRTGKEIEGARDVCEQKPEVPGWMWKVAVSRDGRWVVTASHTYIHGQHIGSELKARDGETGVVKRFEGSESHRIYLVEISLDSTLLAGESWDGHAITVWIWNLESGKLLGCLSPFGQGILFGAGRFSQDSKKLAVLSGTGGCLEVWDVRTQNLDVRVGERCVGTLTETPIFWTTKDKSIVAVFDFKDWNSDPTDWDHSEGYRRPSDLNTIYEFDALTLEIVGAPFEGHTHFISGLALSFDCALLVSASRYDETIKLWAFESRQLLASFDDRSTDQIIFSPNSHQLAYTKWGDTNIYIYDPPLDILSSVLPVQEAQPKVSIPPGSSNLSTHSFADHQKS